MPKTADAGVATATQAAEPDQSAQAEPSLLSRLRALLPWACPVLCCLQLGVLGGVWQWRAGSAQSSMPAPALEERPANASAVSDKDVAADREHAESFIREGRYDLALAVYDKISSTESAAADDGLQYRRALCQEGLGRWDQAVAGYRSLVSRKTPAQTAAAAQIGQARVWIRLRHPAEARPLLGDLILRSAQPALRDGPFLAEARYLLAFAVSVDAFPETRPGPYNDVAAGRLGTEWPVERFLDWATASKTAVSMTTAKPFLKLQRLGPTPAEILVTAFWPSIPAADLLEQAGARSQLRCQWSARAKEQAIGRSLHLEVENLPLVDLLHAAADPLGLVWQVDGTALHFCLASEMDARALQSYRAQTAERSLRGAILAHPGHPLSAAAYLELGDLEMRAERLPEAMSWYDRLEREWPRTPESVAATFNLGLVQQRLDHPPEARQAFFHVVDQAPGHELTPLAYWHIGRLFLERDNDAMRAIAPLRRAAATSLGSPVQPAAALLLAQAYIVEDNPRAAKALLLQYREAVTAPPYREAAAFLSAYARYRSCSDRQEREREAGNLLAAMLLVHDPATLGSVGQLLLGRAYRDLGMLDRIPPLYQAALPRVHGPLAAEIRYALADALEQTDKHEAAVEAWTALAKSGDGHWNRLARFRLAQIACDSGQSTACLDHCRQLLREPDLNELPSILRLMGRAYEAQGQHTRAAHCFAGELPDE